jgi:hypothetical protein
LEKKENKKQMENHEKLCHWEKIWKKKCNRQKTFLLEKEEDNKKEKYSLPLEKSEKKKNKLEITENYSIGKKKSEKRQEPSWSHVNCSVRKKRKTKKNRKSPWIRLADYTLKTNHKTEVTVD